MKNIPGMNYTVPLDQFVVATQEQKIGTYMPPRYVCAVARNGAYIFMGIYEATRMFELERRLFEFRAESVIIFSTATGKHSIWEEQMGADLIVKKMNPRYVATPRGVVGEITYVGVDEVKAFRMHYPLPRSPYVSARGKVSVMWMSRDEENQNKEE